MTEDQLEQEALDWLKELGYSVLHGVDIAPDSDSPERKDYRQVLLLDRLRSAIARLNPTIPLVAQEDAIKQIQDLGVPAQLAANKRFHQLLVTGVQQKIAMNHMSKPKSSLSSATPFFRA